MTEQRPRTEDPPLQQTTLKAAPLLLSHNQSCSWIYIFIIKMVPNNRRIRRCHHMTSTRFKQRFKDRFLCKLWSGHNVVTLPVHYITGNIRRNAYKLSIHFYVRCRFVFEFVTCIVQRETPFDMKYATVILLCFFLYISTFVNFTKQTNVFDRLFFVLM